MYGVEHLLRHVMYVNKREELKPLKIMVADKVTFLALAYCYKQGHHIQYDYMFRKTKFGARGHKRLIKSNYKNYELSEEVDKSRVAPFAFNVER